MTARKIVIATCDQCPHQSHGGGFGAVAYIPWCSKAKRELPWTPTANRHGRCTAVATDEIPDWCPLEQNE